MSFFLLIDLNFVYSQAYIASRLRKRTFPHVLTAKKDLKHW
jgi:hypothetical protein